MDSTSCLQQSTSGNLNKALVASKADISVPTNLKSFSFSDLKNATRNFRPESLLGEGGFGWVYKGWIDANTLAPTKPGTGLVVAIKRLKREGFQGHKEWLVCTTRTFFFVLFSFWPFFLVIFFILILPFLIWSSNLVFNHLGRSELSWSASPWKSCETHRVLLRIWQQTSGLWVHAKGKFGESFV